MNHCLTRWCKVLRSVVLSCSLVSSLLSISRSSLPPCLGSRSCCLKKERDRLVQLAGSGEGDETGGGSQHWRWGARLGDARWRSSWGRHQRTPGNLEHYWVTVLEYKPGVNILFQEFISVLTRVWIISSRGGRGESHKGSDYLIYFLTRGGKTT